MVDRSPRDDEALGELRVSKPLRKQAQNLDLAGGQTGGIDAGRRTRTARQAPLPAFAQPTGDDGGRGVGGQAAELGQRTPEGVAVVGVAEGERGLVRTA